MSGECHVRNCSSLNSMLIVVGTILLLLIMIPSQPVLAIPPQWCVLSGEAANINFIVFGLIQLGLEENILNISAMRLGGSGLNEPLRLKRLSQFSHCELSIYIHFETFHQHLHMEHISLIWSDIPELVVPINSSLIEGCCWQKRYWTKCSYWL